MKRTPLEALILEKSLRVANHYDSGDWVSDLIDREEIPGMEIKNICAKCSVELSDKVDAICALLGIKKRRFLELAIIDAINKAHQIMDDEGVIESLCESNSIQDKVAV